MSLRARSPSRVLDVDVDLDLDVFDVLDVKNFHFVDVALRPVRRPPPASALPART